MLEQLITPSKIPDPGGAHRISDSMVAEPAGPEQAGVTCGICHNDHLQSVGELDSCFHRSVSGVVMHRTTSIATCTRAFYSCADGMHVTNWWLRHLHHARLLLVGCRFCFPCILQWSQIESRCPFCKARFARLLHRRLSPAAQEAPDAAQGYLDGRVLEVLSG